MNPDVIEFENFYHLVFFFTSEIEQPPNFLSNSALKKRMSK